MKLLLSELKNGYPTTGVFSDKKRENFVCVSAYPTDNNDFEIGVVLNSIIPNDLELLGKFEADSGGDFNYGMINILLIFAKKTSKLFKKAKKLAKHGI